MIEPLYLDLLRFASQIEGADYDRGSELLHDELHRIMSDALRAVDHATSIAAVARTHLGTTDLGEHVWALQTLWSAQPEAIAEAGLQICLEALPTLEPRVLVLPGDVKDEWAQRMNGVSGFTPQMGLILLFVAPRGPWEQWLPYVLAREHHHSNRLRWFPRVYMDGYLQFTDGRPYTLLDNMVYEGLADVFAQALYPHLRAPWTKLARADEKTAWKRLRPRLGDTGLSGIRLAMFGNGLDIPYWAGFALGYWIVQGFRLKYPKASLDDLLHMDARAVFRECGLRT